MAFIKTHLISLIAAVATLAFIAIGILGMMSDSVVKKMEQCTLVAGQIRTLRAAPKNNAIIEAEAERNRAFEEQYNKTREVTERINRREPLIAGVFPTVERDKLVYDFRDEYVRALDRLPRGELEGGDLPNQREIQDAVDDVEELLEQKREQEAEGGGAAPPIGTTPSQRRQRRTTAPPVSVAGMGAPRPSGPPGTASISVGGMGAAGTGAAPRAAGGDPKYDPNARAAITKARGIRCYVSVDPAKSSFHISPIWDPAAKPTPDQMWYAQVGLWIQQDVVDAIADVNEQAAKQLPEDEAYVENMPVKRLQSVHVLGYLTENGPVAFMSQSGGPSGGPGGTILKPSFTGRSSNKEYDVVRFQVVVVVDQRALLKLIDHFTKQNFYQSVGLSFQAITAKDQDYRQGYLYGTAPVVRATLDFEGYMARIVYQKMFPAEVREQLGIDVAQAPRP